MITELLTLRHSCDGDLVDKCFVVSDESFDETEQLACLVGDEQVMDAGASGYA